MSRSWSKRIVDWTQATFGPVKEPYVAARRFTDELEEFITAIEQHDEENIGEEAADMVITLSTYIKRRTNRELSEWVEMKMQINEARAWKCNGDGTGKRVKSSEQDAREAEFRRAWWRGP